MSRVTTAVRTFLLMADSTLVWILVVLTILLQIAVYSRLMIHLELSRLVQQIVDLFPQRLLVTFLFAFLFRIALLFLHCVVISMPLMLCYIYFRSAHSMNEGWLLLLILLVTPLFCPFPPRILSFQVSICQLKLFVVSLKLDFILPSDVPTSPSLAFSVLTFPKTKLTPILWHRRFGHLGMDAIREALTKEYALGLQFTSTFTPEHCIACVVGKSPQHSAAFLCA